MYVGCSLQLVGHSVIKVGAKRPYYRGRSLEYKISFPCLFTMTHFGNTTPVITVLWRWKKVICIFGWMTVKDKVKSEEGKLRNHENFKFALENLKNDQQNSRVRIFLTRYHLPRSCSICIKVCLTAYLHESLSDHLFVCLSVRKCHVNLYHI